MIRPVNGRIVHFYSRAFQVDSSQPLAAIVTHVHDDRLVDLTVFHPAVPPQLMEKVPLIQPGDQRPAAGDYCEWMPYQIGQAAKTEEVQQKLDRSCSVGSTPVRQGQHL